ncbi:UTP:RNA uridylyltransferase 1-like isoform X2 [Cornus florida]|uniref:UTP:RNA uridylyltransferase 1-like isoform X2 n=1 Tax=Cornus florida TaxID=4283 RepID=UPI0028A06DAD|nr:UTP:RNA uridylyltransferase 1-like isoform X2 [Cornus florida]
MLGGEGDAPLQPPENGGEFLLKMLRKPPHQHQTPLQPPPYAVTGVSPPTPSPPTPESLTHDPAVAAVGPTLPFLPFPSNNGHDLPYHPPWPQLPPFAPHNYFIRGPPQNPNSNPNWPSPPPLPLPLPLPPGFNQTHHHQPVQLNHQLFGDDIRKLGFSGTNPRPISTHQQEHKLMFGSLPCEIRNNEGVSNGSSHDNLVTRAKIEGLLSKERDISVGDRRLNGVDNEFRNSVDLSRDPPANSRASRNHEQERRGSGGSGSDRHQHGGNYSTMAPSREVRRPPPGFSGKQKQKDAVNRESRNRRRSFEHNVDRERGRFGEPHRMSFTSNAENDREGKLSSGHLKARGNVLDGLGLTRQLDSPGPPTGSNLHSVSVSDIEESLLELHGEIGEDGDKVRRQDKMKKDGGRRRLELDDFGEQLMGSLAPEDELDDKNDKRKHKSSREKGYRSDMRGQNILGQRMRNFKRQIECRADINRLNAPFLAIYESLIPAEEEKAKQKQLLTLLENLVSKEWPEAQLYLYGSCANSFGVSKCDIDVCLAIKDTDVDKSEILLTLADILQSNNLQNVQALTRARVPIVKLMDPVTGISCDICINNILAVVNTKLLRDYAQIDVRLRQLTFIVKHWAKSRGVNETYQGTLSSYAYVLMCIHFLQQRKPAILPCLQQASQRLD